MMVDLILDSTLGRVVAVGASFGIVAVAAQEVGVAATAVLLCVGFLAGLRWGSV
jgi:hypothetical protein